MSLRFIFDFTIFSHRNWRISHALSHHLFPNLDLDMEASALEPYLSFMRNQQSNRRYFVFMYWLVMNCVIGFMEYFKRLHNVIIGIEAWHAECLLPAAELATLLVFNSGDWRLALQLWFIMHVVSVNLLVLVSTPVHRSPYSW